MFSHAPFLYSLYNSVRNKVKPYELIQGSNVWGILTNSLSSTTGQGASLCYANGIIVASYGGLVATKVEYNTTETIVWRVNTSI